MRASTDRRWLRWPREALPPLFFLGLITVAWSLEATRRTPFILPSPLEVWQAGWETRGLLAGHIVVTMTETALGLGIGLAFAVIAAAAMDLSGFIRRALYPVLVASQTIQVLAIAPLLIIWFRFGLTAKVLIVILTTFFPMAVSTAQGLGSADPDLISLLRAMGARRWQTWWTVRLPAALPSFFAGLRVAVTYSVVGATIAEWVGGSAGLGVYMLRSNNALATDQVFAGMLVTTLLSIGLFLIVTLIERLSLPWYYSVQRAEQWEETGIY